MWLEFRRVLFRSLETLPTGMEMQLLEACRLVTRQLHENGSETFNKKKHFAPGALKLIHFLATENQKFLSKQASLQGEAQWAGVS